MNRFVTETSRFRVRSLQDKATGYAFLFTEISIRGNHLRGPVPVSIQHVVRFEPDEDYWERDEDHPGGETFSWSTSKTFESTGERDAYFSNRFEKIVEPIGSLNAGSAPLHPHQ